MSVSNASDLNNCMLEKYKIYTKAKEQWQIESTEIIKRHSPSLSEVAELYMRDQLVLIEKNYIAVKFLLSSEPSMVSSKKKLNQWLSLSRDEEQALAKKSEQFGGLHNIEHASQKRAPHPGGDKLRLIMRAKIMTLPEFQRLLTNFNSKIKEANNRKCDAT